jgi:hypothetical protein
MIAIGPVVKEILDAAKSTPINLVLMETCRPDLVGLALMGSIAPRVMADFCIPVVQVK